MGVRYISRFHSAAQWPFSFLRMVMLPLGPDAAALDARLGSI
jgi:hypothetical protein